MALGCMLATASCQEEDPFDFGGPRSCSIADQNEWIYGLMQQVYLWGDGMPEVDPTEFDSPEALIAALRDPEFDRWSRVSDRERTSALFEEGKVVAFGLRTKSDPDGALRIASIYPDSPAAQAGMRRGDTIVRIGGLTTDEITEQDRWGDIYGPNEPGVVLEFEVASGGESRVVALTKGWVTMQTVPTTSVLGTPDGPVGYLVFTSFVDPSIEELDDAFATFGNAGVRRVVIDLRYNGGGLISVAYHLINLLVGEQASGGIAYKLSFAAGLSDQDSARSLRAVEQSLPAVEHVVFVTTGSTLSASELVINGVLPHADVSIVGSTTGGKPVGARQWEFCDKVIAPITFRLLNANDEGNYFDGFEPTCTAADGLDTPLGNPTEASLAEALTLLDTGVCSPPVPDEDAPEGAAGPGLELRAPAPSPPGAYPGIDALRGLI